MPRCSEKPCGFIEPRYLGCMRDSSKGLGKQALSRPAGGDDEVERLRERLPRLAQATQSDKGMAEVLVPSNRPAVVVRKTVEGGNR